MHVEELIRKLSAYIAEHPPVLRSGDADTILDALFWAYSEAACADSQAVLQYNENLNHLLNGLPVEHANTIIDIVNDLCWEHDRLGFINGFAYAAKVER